MFANWKQTIALHCSRGSARLVSSWCGEIHATSTWAGLSQGPSELPLSQASLSTLSTQIFPGYTVACVSIPNKRGSGQNTREF